MRRIILGLVCGLLGCGGDPAGTGAGAGGAPAGAATGGTLVFARGSDARSLDPIDVSDGESVLGITQLYDTLVTHALGTTDLEPALATAWEVAPDGLSWTFTLRPGVTFHDGTPCDAAAVKVNLDRLTVAGSPDAFGSTCPYRGEYRQIVGIEAPAVGTVVIRLSEPCAVLLAKLAMFPASIGSPAAIRAHGKEYGRHPVGSGAFRFVEWVADQKIVLVRHDGYWGPKAKLDRVILVPVKEQATRLEQLKRGEAHMMDNVDLAYAKEIVASPALRFEQIPGMNFAYLALNTTRAPFHDPRVRRAVAHAIDKQASLRLLTFGYGKAGPNPMPPTLKGYHDGITDYAYDPARAKALLAEAGHPDGFAVDLWAMNNPRPYMPRPTECGQILKEQLAAVGIRSTIVSPPWVEYLDKTGNGEHPLCLLGWSADYADPDNFLNVLLSAHNTNPPRAQNCAFWKDPETQVLLDEAARVADWPRREALYKQAQERIHAACPMVPLAYLPITMASRKEVEGYVQNPIGLVRLWPVSLQK